MGRFAWPTEMIEVISLLKWCWPFKLLLSTGKLNLLFGSSIKYHIFIISCCTLLKNVHSLTNEHFVRLTNSRIQSSKSQFYPGWAHQKCRIPLISQPRCCNPVCIFSTAFPESEVARSGLAVTLSNGWFCAARLELSSLRPWTEPLSKQKIPVIALVLSNCVHPATPTPSSPAFKLHLLPWHVRIYFLPVASLQMTYTASDILDEYPGSDLLFSSLSHWSVRLGYKASHVLSRVHVWS